MLLVALLLAVGGPSDLTDSFELPDGLALTLWAESPQLYNPTAIDVDARGRVWVVEAVNYRKWGGRNPGREHAEGDRVVVLEDTDGDGACDRTVVFAQDPELVAPLGIAVVGERVYVSCSPSLLVYTDADGDLVPERRDSLLTGFGGRDHDHGLHSAVAGQDGALYLSVGNAGPHVVTDAAGFTLRSGSIYRGGGAATADNKPGLESDDGRVWTGGLVLRVRPDGSGLVVLAHNFRNHYEVALDSFGDVYTSDNDDDGNGACRTLWCMERGNYGFFSADGSRSWQADHRPGQSNATAHWHQDDPGVVPSGTMNGQGAPTGVCVYEGALLAPWIDGAVLNADAGAGVVYAHRSTRRGASIELEKRELVRASARSDQPSVRWFRPSDVAVGPDGSVFVADWYDPGVGGHQAGDRAAYGRVLRIAPRGAPSAPTAFALDSVEGALAALASPALSTRALGRRALLAAGEPARAALRRAALDERDPRLAARALYCLASPPLADLELVRRALHHDHAGLRAAAVRALALACGGRLDAATIRAEGLARHPDPALRREVALALAGVPLEEKRDLVLELGAGCDGADRVYLEALGLACEGDEDELLAALVPALELDPRGWDARAEALAWRLHPPSAVPALAARALDATLAEPARRRALDALAFVPARAAAEAVLAAAQIGPADLRDYAASWVAQRDEGDWRAFELARALGVDRLEDAQRVWESGVVRSGLVDVALDVAGARTLWLVVDDAGDGNACDWADWIEPRFELSDGARVPVGAWREARAQWGEVRLDRNCAGEPLAVGELDFAAGIGTHADSRIALAVPAGARRFVAWAGPDRGGTSQCGGTTTSVVFSAWLAGCAESADVRTWERALVDVELAMGARAEAAAALARHPRGALALARLAERGELDDALAEAARGALADNPDVGVRALAGARIGAARAESAPDAAAILALGGDARRGRAVFLDRERAHCVTCHAFTLGATILGGDVGPDLTRIGAKYAERELVDAILAPSAAIALGYDAWIVETSAGRLLSGFLLADGESLVLKDTAGRRHVLAADEVVARERASVSIMPAGLASGLSNQELADLVAFLAARPGGEPLFGDEVVLFDGTDLAAWTHHSSDPRAALGDVWSIEAGVLVCAGEPIGYLRTRERYESFRLTLEWRFDPARGAGNSGALVRVIGPDEVWPRSIEVQLHAGDAGDLWNIGAFPLEVDPARTRGRRTERAQPASERALGEWNRCEILLDGARLEARVNGVLQNRADWCLEQPGFVALQAEGAPIQFRDVRLQPIVGRR